MKRLFTAFALVALTVAAPALAATPFDGTWKGDIKSATYTAKPYELRLAGGTFHCGDCTPAFDIKADGNFHPVKGHAYYDEAAVKVIDDRRIEQTNRKVGKVTSISKLTVNPDDKTLAYEFADMTGANGKPVTASGRDTRVGRGPAGSHAVSGTWRNNPADTMSAEALTFSTKVDGNKFHFVGATDESYDAVIGGPAVPIKGDIGKTMVAVTRPSPNTIITTQARDGKPFGVWTIVAAADGRSIDARYVDKRDGSVLKYRALKQ